ncbi:mitochondrial coenzyme A transporter SLC25A42-like [Drosophila hydei]|uniref:Mitochondrial coenzyme A transporter SLC25A42 n=1 Tax=Drosophila hydei TaxID=7224 RepID=A0A6J2T096_DROHY|nr:mitochondrial coenzyme A transporter SLC25A42 [Drosophila hydei]XP_023164320.1 mitochondrial coenzyme A transporter SLC25A42 [Drosophila hydei]XP_023164321.1 mitochondrial coenzyme A transporter SLC25A42 [Drosophila hydei]XP_030081902.1 mitochondrial coenzyme A transporter SLC25A42-like [Drosophila hydei]XP_030081903.1 mitochondrial coenzyme A transporter SLC25A42-like [Drosophila hydei]XP_030081904.1 mitochondrial coenzyme A transporter SLC25A42-like [Drosophila hydei]
MSRLIEKPNIAMSITSTGSQLSSTVVTGSAIADDTPAPAEDEDGHRSATGIQTPVASVEQNAKSTSVRNKVDQVLISLISGAAAGALAKTTIAPLDRTKINFQIRKDVPFSFKASLNYLQQTYAKEGVLALWRGNSATMARIVPYAAIQFTSHEQWRRVLQVDQNGANTKGRRFIAGSLAGITSQSLTYPLDLARARMAVTDRYTGYRTLRQVFSKIWVEEGPRTLFRGYWATVLGVIPYAGTSFFTYETLKREYHEIIGNTKPNALVSLAFGAAAGVAGQTASYPLDIVRRRMQTTRVNINEPQRSLTILGTLIKIYREEGIKNGFYKGLSMNWIKGPIAVGISFSTYDLIKAWLIELSHLKRGRAEN